MTEASTADLASQAVGAEPTASGLEADALGPFSVMMQSISFVGPAFSGLLLFQVVAGFAGVSVAFSFLIAGLIMLMLAMSLGTVAARLPSAGGYFAYVTRTVNPRAGFFVSWIFLIYAPIAPGFIVAYTAYVCQRALEAQYGFHLPWWAVLVVVLSFVTVIVYRGIRLSARTLIALGIIEAAIVLALAVWGFATPGRGGFSLEPLAPGSFHGIYLGVVFSLFAYAGWEGSVPLAEESRRPGRVVPAGLVSSVLVIVVLFVITSWGLMVGWGTHALPSLLSSEQAPPLALAHRYWGAAWVLVLLALLNSVICASIASFNTVTRMWYAMARAGLASRRLAHLHADYRTPSYAVAAQALLALTIGLGFGFWLGPLDAFLTLSLLTTLALIGIYVAGNLSVVLFGRGEDRANFKPVRAVVFPLLTSGAVLWVGYKSLDPFPPSPVRWAAVAALAWLALGVAIPAATSRIRRARWAFDAGMTLSERLALEQEAGRDRAPLP